MASDKKDYRNMRLDTEGYKDYLRKRTALSSFYGRMEQYQKDLQRRNENERQEYERQRQDAIRESMKHEQDDVRAEKQYRRWMDQKDQYDKAVAKQTARDVRGDDVRQEKQYNRWMNQLAEQKKQLEKSRQFAVSGDDVRQEKQYKRYLDALENQRKLQEKSRKYAVSGDDVRDEKSFTRYMNSLAEKQKQQEQSKKEWQQYMTGVGKDEKALMRAESRYRSAKESADRLAREQPEKAAELKRKSDQEEWQEILAQINGQKKNTNNVFKGDMDYSAWMGQPSEEVRKALQIRNARRATQQWWDDREAGKLGQNGDIAGMNQAQRDEYRKELEKKKAGYQQEIEQITRDTYAGKDLLSTDEQVQQYMDILEGDYSDEEKIAAQEALEQLYSEGETARTDGWESQEKRKRTAEDMISYTDDLLAQLDYQDRLENRYNELMSGEITGDTSWDPAYSVQREEINDAWDTMSVGRNVDDVYNALNPEAKNWTTDITDTGLGPVYLMNDEMRDRFISLYKEGKKDEAWAFFEGVRPYLNQAYHYFEKTKQEEEASRNPIISTIGTEAAHILQPAEFIANLPAQIKALITGEQSGATDPYSSNYALARYKNTVRSKIAENLGDWGWLYSGAMSGVDSALNVALAKGIGLKGDALQYGTLGLFGTQAFDTSLQNAMEEGNGNFAYDVVEAFIDSAIETATEIWSVENWLADPTNILTYVAKIGISEPSEEIVGAVVEPYIKELLGHKNQYKEREKQIVAAGGYWSGNKWVEVDNADDAKRQAMREWNHDIRMAAQEALLSVGPAMVYGSAQIASQNRNVGRQIQNQQNGTETTGLDTVLEAAKGMDPGTRSYQEAEKISKRLEQNKAPGNYRVGQLASDMMRESKELAEEKSKNALHDEVFRELSGKEIKGSNTEEMTDLIMKAIDAGGIDNLSKKERVKIHDSSIAYNTYLKYVYASEQSTRAMEAQEKATQAEQKAMKSVSDALSNRKVQTQAEDTDFVGRQLATQEDIDRAEGKRTKRPDEIIVDRKYARLDGMELVDEGDGKQKWMYKVQTENGTEYKDASEIKATNFSTAAVVRQQQLNPEVYSGDYTNELLKQINTQPNTKIGRYMMEAEQVRWAAFAGLDMPATSAMSEKQAQEIYRISQMDKQKEWAADQASRTENFRGRGQGQAFFDGAEFGTEEWTKKLDGMDLSQDERQLVEGLAAFAQDSGIRFDFVDQINGNDYIHGSENQGGIRIALQSYDSARAKQEGRTHHLAVTVGHELTHWMRRNNAAGYIELQDYVMRSMNSRGINVAARAMEMMENRRRNGDNLTMSGAIEEIVANACDQTLGSEEGVRHLEESSPKLAEKIRNFVKDLVQRIKAAIGTGEMLNSASRDALRMVGEEANRLHKLWWGKFDETLNKRVQELQAPAEGQTEKAAASQAENVRLSQAEFTNGIQKGMSDEQRYDVLKNTKVTIANSAGKITNNELTYYGELNKYNSTEAFRKLALRNGIINTQFENKYIKNLPAVFSLKSLRESMHHHEEEGYTNLAALMPVFKETFENAVPIMAQEDRYKYVVRDNTALKTYIQLLGAYRFGNQIIPVKFEIKENEGREEGKLYIVATINKDAILTNGPQMSGAPAPASSVISIEEIIQNVNKDDIDILYTIPAQFLTGEQQKGKRLGLAKNGNYIRAKAEGKNKTKNYHVNMTAERINSLIDEYGDNSNAYVAYINPQAFVDLTANDYTQVMNESHPMNGSELRNEKQTPVIRIDSSTGDIISSDGQKRLQAMALAGVRQVAVLVVDETAANDGNRKTIDSLDIHGNNNNDKLRNLVPVNNEHRDELISTFSNENGWFKYSMAELDAEYEEAVNRGDVNRAEQMLMDRYQQMEQQGVIGYRAPHFNNGEYAEIAKRIKTGDPEAIRSAARDMAQMVPENAVLIPMPPHSGQVTADTDTMLLARAISEITGRPVINALASGEHISRQEAKTNNIRGVDAKSMGFTQIAEIPEDAMPVFIDNMVGGGVTAKAAHDAVGRGITVAYAQSARAKTGGAKFIGITKNNGELIPLSQRMDPDNKSWKYSMAEDDAILSMTDPDSASVGAWMMQQTPSSVHTEGERALIQEYRGLRTALDLTRKRLNDYNTHLKRLQAKKGMLTAEERATLTELEAKIQVQQDKQTRLEQELYDVTRGEGFAAMMYRNAQIYKDYIEGKNQVQVEAAVDRLMSEAEAAEKKIGARQKQLNRMSEEEAVKTVRRELRNRGLKQSAAVLKDSFFTTMSTGELEARLAEIALKAVNNEGPDAIRSAVESLAADIVASPVSMQAEDAQDNLRPLKGRTITFSPSEQAEMKAIGWTLADIRSKVKGSGVTVKFGDVSTLQADLDEIAKEVPGIRNELESGSAEQAAIALVDWIEGQMSRMKGNPRDYDIDPKSVEMIIVSCAKQLLDEKQGGMSRAALAKRIETAAGELGKLTDAVNSLMESVQQIKQGAVQASNAAGGLRGDTAAAVDYYNLIARQAAEVERARVKRDVIEKLRSENTKKLIEQEMKFREQMKKDKRARELRTDNEHLRNMITTDVKRLKDRLVAETDQKNIQEEAKPLARALIGMFVDHDMAGFRRVLNADKKQLADVQMRLGKMQALEGEFDPDADLDFLVIKAPNAEDNDYSMRDAVWEDLAKIETGLLEYRNAEGLGVVSLADRKAALEKIQEATSEIYDVIRARETAFIAGQKRNVMELATQMERDMANSRFKGERRGRGSQVRDWFWNDVGYGNLTPEYFFKNLRNRTLSLLHDGFHEAEKRSGLEAREAQRRIAQIAEECGYATWDGQEKKTVTLTNGKKIEMSVEQLMALYATWNREKNALRPEETSHLLKGGFVLAEGDTREGKARREKTSQRPIRVNEFDLDSIGSYLTEQQKDFVDRIVGYMSSDLAQLGNEASLRTYGIKKFTETYYFPTKSWGGVLNKSSSAGVTNNNDNRAMRQSFSKRIRAGAQNALEIGDFTATAMKHITGMITFNTVGPAVENLNKVLNQQLDYYEDEEMDPDEAYKRNMRAAFQENYGKMAYDYLAQFMKDVNGGVARRNETIMREKLLSIFKKNAVAGSLSVAAQQPLSYIRAAMLISPKYLAAAISPQYWRGSYEEMMSHSGVAVIKDMGKFDMNFGQSMTDYITPEGMMKTKDRIKAAGDTLTALPGKMDAMTWTRMWSACKLEQAALHPEMDVKSEDFLDMVADRFEELMRRTQVYDSVMVKSQNMRSDNYLNKIRTSFMAEPTLSLNVLADAWMNMKEKGGKANAAKALATFILSAAAQAGAKAFFGTGRSPDKKKTEEENFLNKFLQNLLGEANPFGLIPGYSQLVEVLINGELNDDAMGMIAKAKDTVQRIVALATGDIGKKGLYRDLEDSVGQLIQIATDVPLKNFMRDFRAMVNWFSGGSASGLTGDTFAQRETSAAVLRQQSLENLMTKELGGLMNAMLGSAGYKTDNTSYVRRIYEAQKKGNEAQAAEIREYMEKVKLNGSNPGKWIDSQLNAMLKEDDSLSTEEKMDSLGENGYGSMGKYINDQYRAGEIDRKTAEEYYKKENPTATDKDVAKFLDKTDWERDGKLLAEGQKNYTNYTPLLVAMQDNKAEDIRDAVEHMKGIGYEPKDIKKEINGEMKKKYLDADANGRIRLKDAMQKAYKALGFTAEDADKTISNWTKENKK